MTEELTPDYQEAPAPVEWKPEDVPAPAPAVEVVEVVEVVEEHHEVEPEVVVEEPTPEPVVEPVAKSKNEDRPTPAANKRGGKDVVVHTSALVFKSNARNSVSVGLVQERLVALGHTDAGSDKYGWLGEGTMKSLAEFAKTSVDKIDPQDDSLIKKLFAGTQVKVVF